MTEILELPFGLTLGLLNERASQLDKQNNDVVVGDAEMLMKM